MPKKPYPADRLRVAIYGRVKPTTIAILDKLGQPNAGRAIDLIADNMTEEFLAVLKRAARKSRAAAARKLSRKAGDGIPAEA